jgi:hypothetical protein
MINVNWAEVVGGGIVLSLAALTYLGWCVLTTAQIKRAERQDRERFDRDMKNAPVAPWNGETYDWTPEQLRSLSDTAVYAGPNVADTDSFPAYDPWAASADPRWAPTGPIPPVPASTISGPLPVQEPEPYAEFDADAEAEAFLKKMHEDNEAFLAGLRDL